DLRSFGFEAQVTLLLRRATNAVDELAVHRQLDHAIDGDHVIGVPFAPALAAVFDGLASLAPGGIGYRLHAVHAEEFAVHVGDIRKLAVLDVQFGPIEFEHLNLDAVRQAARGIW